MINKNPPSCRCTQNNMLSPQLLRVHIQPTMRPYCANSQYRGRYKFHQMRANFSYFVTTSKQKLFYMFLNSCPFSGMCLGISSCVFFCLAHSLHSANNTTFHRFQCSFLLMYSVHVAEYYCAMGQVRVVIRFCISINFFQYFNVLIQV